MNRPTGSPRPSLAERMTSVARTLWDQTCANDVLQAAADAAVVHIDGCEAASLTIVRARGRADMGFATSQEAAAVDRLQAETDTGPSLDAIRRTESVYVSDLAQDQRWPLWGPRAAAQTGLRSVLSLRVFTSTATVGTLNCYATSPQAFTSQDHTDGVALAAQVAVATHAALQIERLEASQRTRTVIGQAIGMLMERYDVDASQAWALLARLSSQHQVRIHQLATELVSTRTVPGLDRARESPTPR